MGNLRVFLIYYFEFVNVGEWMAFGRTMLIDSKNVGKMVIPCVFDSLLGIKPKNTHIASLLFQESGSQDIDINLTKFHYCIDKRVNHCSSRAERARNFVSNLFNAFATGVN